MEERKDKRNKNKFEKDGVVLLNKESGISSFSAINKLKWLLNAKKVGHAGTLDPMAQGLLVVMINNATKFSDNLMKKDKEYYVEMELGYETDSYDTDGQITKVFDKEIKCSLEDIKNVVNKFVGTLEQIPPMYSAIKIKGEKLYNLARKGIEVERKARKIKINYINDIKYTDSIDTNSKNKKIISFVVGVSSGTYIRSLVRDIGQELGVYATMSKLIRTKIGNYDLKESVKLSDIAHFFEKNEEKMTEVIIENIDTNINQNDYKISEIQKELEKIILFKNIELIFEYDSLYINEDKYKKIKNGMTVIIKKDKIKNIEKNKKMKIYSTNIKEFLGIVEVIKTTEDKVYIKRDKYIL